MSELTPPPRIIDKFTSIWKEWLGRVYNFIFKHTSGNVPTTPATGSSWNAHGNTATGDATQPLRISGGSFLIEGTTGDHISTVGTPGSYFYWLPSKKALIVGETTTTGWADENDIGTRSLTVGRNALASGGDAIAMGSDTTCSGSNSLALGYQCSVITSASVAVGYGASTTKQATTSVGSNTEATALFGCAFGYNAYAYGTSSVAIGVGVTAGGQSGVTIGTGVASANTFVNNQANSVAIGANIDNVVGSDLATLFLLNKKCGIEQESPLSTLDVGGSVGYKYQIITSAQSPPATPLTLSDQLTVIVDNSLGPVSLNLPATSGVDRRIYHIKRGYSGGGAVKVYAASGEYIDGVLADSTTSGYTISAQDAPMILCDDTSLNNGWWIL